MSQLRRVAVGVDFSEDTDRLTESAAVVARRSGAAIDLIHVLRAPPVYSKVLGQQRAPIEEAVVAAGRALEEVAASSLLAGLTTTCHVKLGSPEREIPEVAKLLGDELILVGHSDERRGPFGVGRTGARTARSSEIPVMITKRPLAESPKRVLATTDFSVTSRPAVEEGARLARLFGCRLEVVHIIEPCAQLTGWAKRLTGEEAVYLVEPEDLAPEWDALLEDIDLSGIEVTRTCLKGETVSRIVEEIRPGDDDVLVMASHGRGAVAHALMGSTAESVLEEAMCPVVIVRSPAHLFELVVPREATDPAYL